MWMKTVWILISWLHQKPADLNPHCFQKRGMYFLKVMAKCLYKVEYARKAPNPRKISFNSHWYHILSVHECSAPFLQK